MLRLSLIILYVYFTNKDVKMAEIPSVEEGYPVRCYFVYPNDNCCTVPSNWYVIPYILNILFEHTSRLGIQFHEQWAPNNNKHFTFTTQYVHAWYISLFLITPEGLLGMMNVFHNAFNIVIRTTFTSFSITISYILRQFSNRNDNMICLFFHIPLKCMYY